jgi:hypothetical protein
VWDAEAIRHVIGGPVVTGHRGRGRPNEVVVQHLPQLTVVGEPHIGESLVETDNRAAIHFVVLPLPAVHLDDGGLVTVGDRIRAGATECLGPVSRESLDMLGVEAVAEGMADHFIRYDPTMPGASKPAQSVVAARRLENTWHASMMTILSGIGKT